MKLPKLISFFLLEIFLFFLDKLIKRCHKFTHIFAICNYLNHISKEVFNTSNNKFIHLSEQIFEELYQHRFSHIYGFSLVGSKAFFSSCFKKLFRRSHIYICFWCFLIMIFLVYFTSWLFLYHSIHVTLFFLNQVLQVENILQLTIQILKITMYFVKRLSVK